MDILAKTLAGTVAAGALAVSATPAMAQDWSARGWNHNSRYGHNERYDRYDRYNGRYGVSQREAVRQCMSAAARAANRYSYGHARVTGIRDIDRKRGGYKVEGRIAVENGRRDWRGWNRGSRRVDTGTFACHVDYRGRVRNVDFHGIRGL